MRIAYLDCFSGMSGDMFLGALVDAGVPAALFEETVAALNIGARLEISRVNRGGITATKVDVLVHGEKELPREVYWEQESHSHEHQHGHSHEHEAERRHGGQSHRHESEHPHSHDEHSHGRGLREIKEIISKAKLSESTKRTAVGIFEALGTAEAKIHNAAIETIHFHEVGAVDAMVDIVCAAAGAEFLAVDEFVCSPLNVGGGTVNCAHGTFPVPAPATLELLKGVPVYSSGINFELVTPTGAAIVKTLASRFASFPKLKVEKIGYGAGTREIAGHANVVRLTMGEFQRNISEKIPQETISILEANLDDLNPQVFGYVMDRLLERGALDVFGIPVQMKKSRPGTLLTVLCRPEDADKLVQVIFAETTSLGVRRRDEQRHALNRTSKRVHTRWGDVRIKIANLNGTVTNYAPEYEDCREIAVKNDIPLKAVMQEAVREYLNEPTQDAEQNLNHKGHKGAQR
jgi:pyridinium-3,5-bisthiocarboxylic acid mononucleotide nickel chelatase